MSHTPGPWIAGYGDGITGPRASFVAYLPEGRFNRIPIQREGQPIAWVISDTEDKDNLTPDACLIAAAPDLLEALKDIMQVIRTYELVPESVSYMQQATAAIAKAEGK